MCCFLLIQGMALGVSDLIAIVCSSPSASCYSSVAIVLGVEAWRASLMLHSAKEVLGSSVIAACALEV